MYIEICNTQTKIRKIKFKIPITIDLIAYVIPERTIEVINEETYLSLFIESGKYNKPSRGGNNLARTASSTYLEVKLTEGGFTATFDYSEFEIIRLLKQMALNSIRFKEYITVLDYVGLESMDSDFTVRTGIIKEVQHTGTFSDNFKVIDGIESSTKYVENGFSLTFSEDIMYYV